MIWAQAHGRVIGVNGTLPWDLPEDLRLFQRLTRGSTVLMGRATWQSLPAAVRPLPGRTNLVLTRSADWSQPGASPVATIAEALDTTSGDLWVIGGARVYAAAEPYASEIVRTDVDLAVAGDTYAPELSPAWVRVHRDPGDGWRESATGTRYAVTRFRRI